MRVRLVVAAMAAVTALSGLGIAAQRAAADGTLQWLPEKMKEVPEGVTEMGVTGWDDYARSIEA